MQSLSPYSEGSDNEKKLIEFIQTRLALLEIPFSTISFDKSKNSHSFSRNIEAQIDGEKDNTLVICIPLNTPIDIESTSNEHSINIALAVSLLSYFKKNPQPITIKTVFLGAEFGDSKQYPLGTNLFLSSFYPETQHIILYFNFNGIPEKVSLDTGSTPRISPAWIVQNVSEVFNNNHISFTNSHTQNQMYRTNLMNESTIIAPFLKKEYPAIGFSSLNTVKTDLEKKEFIINFQKSIIDLIAMDKENIPDEWDQHYLFFNTPITQLIITETEYIVVISILFIFLILIGFLRRQMIRKYINTMRNNFLYIPLIFIIAFILLILSTFLIEGLLFLRDLPTVWRSFPILFLILKLSIFLFFCGIAVKVLQQTPFSKSGSFFSVTALFFTIISLITISIINISFSYYFVWTLIFIILFTLSRKRIFKVIFFIFSPVLVFGIIYDIFSIPMYNFCEIILFNKIYGNLLIAVIILPFVLLLVRIRLLFRYHTKIFFSIRTIVFSILFLLISAGIITTISLYSPFSMENPAPISIIRTINHDTNRHFLSFSSPERLPILYLDDPDFSGPVASNTREYSISLPGGKDYFSYSITGKSFLKRKNVSVTLSPKGDPDYIEAVLTSTRSFVLYDSNFPFTKSEDANLYKIHIGVNWPKTMPIQITLPPDNVYDLSITLHYKNPPEPLNITNTDLNIEYSLLFKKTIHFEL